MASTSTSQPPTDFFYGWDLLFTTIGNTVNKKHDVVIVLTHFLLTRHYNFRCVGIGDDKTLQSDDVGSELLPENWNVDDTKYALRYVCDDQLFLLIGHTMENSLVLNLLDVSNKKVSNICIEPNEAVTQTTGPLTVLMPQVASTVDRIRRELLDPIYLSSKREVTTQTNTTRNHRADLHVRIGSPRRAPVFL